jgi:S1-C subfamily serine protease
MGNKMKKTLSALIMAALLMLSALPAQALAGSEIRLSFMRRPARLSAEMIFEQNADAVFMIETFDSRGETIRTGSGFFISAEGHAATCLHVFDDAVRAEITMYDGTSYPVLGALASSEEFNLVIFTVDSDNDPDNYLSIADSDLVETGNTVYALGSPVEMINSITEGIISNTKREVDGETLIQFSAPISFGSGGSAVLNALGQVIGVASSSFSYGQNMNLAIPINHIKTMTIGRLVPLSIL